MKKFFQIGSTSIKLSNIKTYGIATDPNDTFVIYREYDKKVTKQVRKAGLFRKKEKIKKRTERGQVIVEKVIGRCLNSGYENRGNYYAIDPKHCYCPEYIDDMDDYLIFTGSMKISPNYFDYKWSAEPKRYLYVTTYQNDNYRFYETEHNVDKIQMDLKKCLENSSKEEIPLSDDEFNTKLSRLSKMKDSGLLSDEEFEEQKKILLKNI